MSSHLKQFSIESFRGLRDVKLEGLGRFNLIVGENNSGKTSILESLMLFLAPGNTRNWIKLLSFRDTSANSRSVADLAGWLFPLTDRDHPDERLEIKIQGLISDVNETLTMSYLREIEIVPPEEQRRSRIADMPDDEPQTRKIVHVLANHFSDATGERSGELIFGRNARRGFIGMGVPEIDDSIRRLSARKSETIKPHSHRAGRAAVGAVSNAVLLRMKDLLISVLQIFDPDIEGVDVVSPDDESTLVIEHRKLGIVPVHLFGDGLRKAVVVVGQALRAEGGILLIDEVETALHHKVQEPFFQALRKIAIDLDVQIFATTHSLEAVDAIVKGFTGNEQDLVAYRLDKANDATIVTAYPGHLLRETRYEMGFEIR